MSRACPSPTTPILVSPRHHTFEMEFQALADSAVQYLITQPLFQGGRIHQFLTFVDQAAPQVKCLLVMMSDNILPLCCWTTRATKYGKTTFCMPFDRARKNCGKHGIHSRPRCTGDCMACEESPCASNAKTCWSEEGECPDSSMLDVFEKDSWIRIVCCTKRSRTANNYTVGERFDNVLG